MLVEGRRQLTGLRNSAHEDPNVADLLRKSGDDLAQAYNVGFAANVTGESVQLPEHVREEVVRIGREALLNAFRHASASLVRLDIAQSPERLELVVADNGRGLPASAATDTEVSVFPSHWGLIGSD